ncbi:MAG TPA: branched-chain amino acid ABC transporter permease [Treponemataceae bacterium]|jgi:branched-chain amino acid transport system permease protein|nr:branched-chain amino acid ABC transporter permease [Treponemataceae bacterium]
MKKYSSVLIFLCIAVLIPIFTSLAGKNFYLTQLTMAAYYALAALGLCLLLGYAGQISLGQAGFFAIGGYISAILSNAGLDPRLAFIVSIISAALIAFIIGIPVLKLKGHYLAMATLGFGVIIEKLVRGIPALGGADGISNVPDFPLIGSIHITGGRADRMPNYIIAFTLVALALFVLTNLLSSRSGRALRAIHESEDAASAAGVNTARTKLITFIIAAVSAAVAGSLLTHYNGSIGPGEAAPLKSIRYLSIVAVGGISNIAGTLAAGLILNFLSLRGVFGVYDDAVFGVILVAVMILAPEGFKLSIPSWITKKITGRKRST